jgi:uncharacterized protein YndB with AHSA1/START domain
MVAAGGFTCTVDHLEAKRGGTFKMSFTEFDSGHSHGFGGEYLELAEGEKLVYTNVFDDPNLKSEITLTVVLKAATCDTDMTIIEAGVPDSIPQEMYHVGRQDSLKQLAQFVKLGTALPEFTRTPGGRGRKRARGVAIAGATVFRVAM